jgi:protein-L-isoaspartate(D-aspartate) O-methyltransferase
MQMAEKVGQSLHHMAPFMSELKVLDKKLDGSVSIRDATSVRYVPLTSKEAQLHAD